MAAMAALLVIYALGTAVLAQPNDNIQPGSSLTTSMDSKWTSSNGEFAFGLYNITSTQYLLGVWLENTSPKTLVWTANRTNPVDAASTLHLSQSELRLLDSQGNQKWSVDGSISGAAMQSDGNFVLFGAPNQPIWQSFENPTDTLLPGQQLNATAALYSKSSEINYFPGRFKLVVKDDGKLVINPVDLLTKSVWEVPGTSPGKPCKLKFNISGLYLVDDTGEPVWKNISDGGWQRSLQRVTLDWDGVLRRYVWSTSRKSWSSVFSTADDPCNVGRQCGLNGYCQLTSEKKPNCTCPPGFDFMDNKDPFRGCKRISTEQMCGPNSSIETLENINWPEGDYSVLNVKQEDCKKACSDDCNCIVAIYTTGAELCWKKQMPLQHGRDGADNTLAFIKVPIPSDPPPLPQDGSQSKGNTLLVIGISLLSCSSIIWGVGSLAVCWYKLGPNANSKVLQQEHKSIDGLKSFTYKEMQTATGGFKEELGRGACSRVHKGTLSDGRDVAVKSLDIVAVEQGRGEREFVTEMGVIGSSHHRNLVRLYGFCSEGSHRLLVYEYMSNGSLERPLFGEADFLDWRLRVQIAKEIARGMLYLHEECTTQILHCDIKPQNILLDENYSAKVSDFGLAKLMNPDQTRTYTLARGTPTYIAPEWHRKLSITAKVDVYSFGVMLLEIICCRKSVKLDASDDEIILLEWIYHCFERGQLLKLVERDQSQGNAIEQRELERMVLIGLWCSQEDPCMRPSMKGVVHMLEGIVEIPTPPPPNFH